MKKILMVAITLIASVSVFAQVQFTSESAEKWFKENYVSQNFKDPYSFKLAKITIDTITIEKKTKLKISSNEYKLKNIDEEKKQNSESIKMALKYVGTKHDKDGFWAQRLPIYEGKKQELDNLPLIIDSLKNTLTSMSEIDRKKTSYLCRFYKT